MFQSFVNHTNMIISLFYKNELCLCPVSTNVPVPCVHPIWLLIVIVTSQYLFAEIYCKNIAISSDFRMAKTLILARPRFHYGWNFTNISSFLLAGEEYPM